MAEKDTSTLLILTSSWRSGCIAEWSEAARFSLEKFYVAISFFFFSFIVFLPFGFLLFILTADPVSFARFFRKHISSRGGTITAILYEEKKGTSGLRKTCPHRPQ